MSTAGSSQSNIPPQQDDLKKSSLRNGMLAGQHTQPDWDFESFEDFLKNDRDALSIWLGDDLFNAFHPTSSHHLKTFIRGQIDRDLAQIDTLIAQQIDAILHHPRFSRFEGSWRGLHWLVSSCDPAENIHIRVFSMKWHELERDFARALEFDQSSFFKLIYEDEFGHPGGQPFGLLVIDHEIAHQPKKRTAFDPTPPVDDVAVLRQIAAVSAAAFIPTILTASPRLLGVESFSELSLTQHITAALADMDHIRWRSFVTQEDTRFLCLTLPRMRARARWSRDNNILRHEEYAPSSQEVCWHSASYAFARNVLRAQHNYNWPADVRGVTPGQETGSFVSDTVKDPFRFGAITQIPRAPIEVAFSAPQTQDLLEAGFMPLNTLPFGGTAFASTRSLQATPTTPRNPTAEQANRRISAEIVSLLCVCRFAHHIKMLGRDMIGRIATPSALERELQDWLGRYTNASSLSSGESRARYPLLSSRVAISAREDQPGHYGCIIHLQPHYQLDDISTTFRLVTTLSSAERSAAPAQLETT
ncbi:type VI secretion system contractile sheath large subunit [Swingsia samuiensis]|uniref:Type VI secretion system contractile sheath large subunit n=1 Tax=Swingsia samuiensis TaxID=1293412 RepID=A0A4Y6UI38_9PROT|nr:type VI secretion system contractile sheath large subunit [Swingsia samuiensis]QDH16328.1 type VI secretion system contractile sheath large subunit [Swingsia samuiensis]